MTPAASTCGTGHRGLGAQELPGRTLTLLTAEEGLARVPQPLPPSSRGPQGSLRHMFGSY